MQSSIARERSIHCSALPESPTGGLATVIASSSFSRILSTRSLLRVDQLVHQVVGLQVLHGAVEVVEHRAVVGGAHGVLRELFFCAATMRSAARERRS
jgi:hypothetical protein